MRFQYRLYLLFPLIAITSCGGISLYGQLAYPFITPKIDSICTNTLDYIRIKQSLTLQQFEVEQEALQLEKSIEIIQQQLE